MFKRLIRTIFFLLLIAGASTFQVKSLLPIVLPVCVIGIICMFGLGVYHIKYAGKKSLFCLILATTILINLPAFAVNPAQEDVDFINNAKSELCGADLTSSDSYDSDLLEKAHNVIDKANKISASGFSLSGVTSSALDCATKYVENASGLESMMSPTCSPITALILKAIDSDDGCWACNIVKVIIDSIQSLAVNAYPAMRSIAIGLLGITFLFWIAIRVIIFFGQMGFARIGEFFTNIIQQMLLVLVLAALLYTPVVHIYRLAISPFIIASADIANQLTAMADRTSGYNKTPIAKITRILDKIGLAEIDCDYCDKMTSHETVGNTFLDQGAVNACLCMVCTIHKQVTPFIELGKTLSCFGTQIPKMMDGVPGFSTVSIFSFDNANFVILGWLFTIVFSLFMFLISFYLINIFLELAFALIFTPIFVMCLAFKPTRAYAKKGWELILHSMAVLIAIAVAINLCMVLFTYMLPDSMTDMFIDLFTGGSPSAMLDAFSLAGNNPKEVEAGSISAGWENILSILPMGGSGNGITTMCTILMLIAVIVMGFSIVEASIKMAEGVTNTSGIMGEPIARDLLWGIAAGVTAVKGGLKAGAAIANTKKQKDREKKEKERAAKAAPQSQFKNPDDPNNK